MMVSRGIRSRIIRGATAVALVAVLFTPTQASSATGQWQFAGVMSGGRADHSATLLGDGKVLVAGGQNSADPNVSSNFDIYDPRSGSVGTWSFGGPMISAHADHTATLLGDGRVLIAGGHGGVDEIGPPTNPNPNLKNPPVPTAAAEVYNPLTAQFASTGPLTLARYGHAATRLNDGKVLVSGGLLSNGAPTSSAEMFDPQLNTWSDAGTMSLPRDHHTSTLLPSGKVLVTGIPGGLTGRGLAEAEPLSAELFDPATRTWSVTTPLRSPNRNNHTATFIGNGKVLVVGGSTTVNYQPELYDPASGTWSATSPTSSTRSFHTASLLMDGRVLVTGGTANVTPETELFDPVTGTWSVTSPFPHRDRWHISTLLPNGKVLGTGGELNTNSTAHSYLYDPGPQPQRSVSLNVVRLNGFINPYAKGVVTGPTPWCVSGIKVNILRNGVLIASATTTATGKYVVQIVNSPGNYQAKVKPSIVNDVPCNKALSPIFTYV